MKPSVSHDGRNENSGRLAWWACARGSARPLEGKIISLSGLETFPQPSFDESVVPSGAGGGAPLGLPRAARPSAAAAPA